jgi:hypothetical protein
LTATGLILGSPAAHLTESWNWLWRRKDLNESRRNGLLSVRSALCSLAANFLTASYRKLALVTSAARRAEALANADQLATLSICLSIFKEQRAERILHH